MLELPLEQEHWHIVHVTDSACAVCDIMSIKLTEMVSELTDSQQSRVTYLPLSVNDHPEYKAAFNIVHFPTVMLYFGGKAYKRYEQVFSITEISEDLLRYLALTD